MRTITKTLYSFEELSEEAKEKVLDKFYDINVDYDWWQFTYEDAENIGLKLTSFDLDRNRHAKGEFIYSATEVAANILKEHGEQCETYKTASNFLEQHNTVYADYMDESSENYESYDSEQELIEIEEEFLKDLCEDYSIMLQKECEYLQTEDSIIQTIVSNGYEFDEEGNIQ